jgi:biopolymer transport protein ExbD
MRRMRDHNEELEEDTGEINLVPYMDIVTNIIIFLLASVVNQVSLGNVNITVPTTAQGGAVTEEPPPDKPPLNLTVTVGANGFIVGASGGLRPIIPKKTTGQYDYGALTAELRKIKTDPLNAATDETKANFNADANVPYDVVIATLDAMRQDDKDSYVLFPDVAFAAGVL